MNEKAEKIFRQYEKMTLENFERYNKGEELKADVIHALNDSIRVLHNIAQMRGYVPARTREKLD